MTKRENWYYINSKNNIADLGTKRRTKLSDVLDNSIWVNGHGWAKLDKTQFPIQSFKELKLNKEEIKGYKNEILKSEMIDVDWVNKHLEVIHSKSYAVLEKGVPDKVGERYLFSRYIMDPNKFRFRKVVRIVALLKIRIKSNPNTGLIIKNEIPAQFKFQNVYLVTQGISPPPPPPFNCENGLVVTLSEQNISSALDYFYSKATLEVKKFLKGKSYKNITNEKDGILYYTGCILPSQIINNKSNVSDVCIDLSMESFCVPIIEKFSPLAFAVINEVHWYDNEANHSGNESVMRYVQKIAHIIEGRSLVGQFRKECPRCHYLRKKCIDVAMGPISSDNLSIAPAFYFVVP